MLTFRTALRVVFATLSLLWAGTLYADVRLPGLIASGMVLQQGTAVRIWGWADEGEGVTVGIQGQKVATTAKDGKWAVRLGPLQPGGPFAMTILGKNTLELTDILVGEVWVSCGQSNMMMSLSGTDTGAQAIADSGKYPQIRLLTVPGQRAAATPADDVAVRWQSATPQTVAGFSAVSYFFGRALQEKLQVPVGLINAVAIMPGEAWIDAETLQAVPALREMPARPIKPTTTFNAMIAPLTPYTIKGAIYYQGEYNSGRGREYRQVMPAIIRSWRKSWGQGDFPFLFVQLPGYHQHLGEKDKKLDMPAAVLTALHTVGGASGWAELREAQLLTWQSVPNTGMAVAIDLGDPQDIHPKKKQPVGERLALAARAIAYGEKVVYSGPVFDSLRVEGSAVILRFTHGGSGLKAQGGALTGFELAGPDQRYVWATAVIRGQEIVLSSPEVPTPALVRYAWANYPTGNLYNTDGLPASPFRAVIPGKAYQIDSWTLPFANPSFEAAGTEAGRAAHWVQKSGAIRGAENPSQGAWTMTLPAKGAIEQDNITNCGIYGYDWNSDLLEPDHLRPGTIAGYTVDMAVAPGAGLQTGYMRLCGHSTASGNQYWGGIPTISTASERFVTRQIATRMSTTFDLDGRGMGVGTLFANLGTTGALSLDNLSPIVFIRPTLSVSDTTPIHLGTVARNTAKTSLPRTIANGQTRTLPNKRTDSEATTQVATLLYGVWNVQPSLSYGFEHVWGATDSVGARLVGPQADRFAFVSPHLGATPRDLRLVGADEQGGLLGGGQPETEALTVQFLGAPTPGSYTATVRIVTQAGNTGTLSQGKAGEPVSGLFYLDIPVTVTVTD
jgi:sialate O-acetylesterase